MVSEGSEDVIDENESQQEVSPRLKQKEIREKLRSYYDAGISAAVVIRKDIPGLKPKNHYKLFNEKNGRFKKEKKWKKIYNFKRYWFKI